MNRSSTLLIVAGMLIASPAYACKPGQHHRPPQRALDACAGLAEANSCSFTGRREQAVSGVCELVPRQRLSCVPDGHRRDTPAQP